MKAYSKDKANELNLSELPTGSTAYVRAISSNGLIRRRLLDLGFVPSAEVTAYHGRENRDSRIYRIRETNIALRDIDAREVLICGAPLENGSQSNNDFLTSNKNVDGSKLRTAKSKDTNFEYVIAIAGNPNTGKSTVFNALTGLRQHVGNWPGKTVTRAVGKWTFNGYSMKLVDLPGTYSLLSTSQEEEIARDFILFGAPDCTIIVADAVRLERNLNLVLQILEITDRAVVCVNLIDEAHKEGIRIDARKLEDRLGVPVVLTAARSRVGLDELRDKVYAVASGAISTTPVRITYEPELQKAVDQLIPDIEEAFPDLPNARWIAMRLIDGGDQRLRTEIEKGILADMAGRIGAKSLSGASPTAKERKR